MSNITKTKKITFRNTHTQTHICTYTNVHVTAINERKTAMTSKESKQEQERVCVKDWRREMEEEMI